MVIDEHHRDLASERPDQLGELRQLAGIESARGLVEQQQLGLANERARQRDPLLDRVRERPGKPILDLLAPDPVQCVSGTFAQRPLV